MAEHHGIVESYFFARGLARIGLLVFIVVGVIVEAPLLFGPCTEEFDGTVTSYFVSFALGIGLLVAVYAFTHLLHQARVEQKILAIARRSSGLFDIRGAATAIGIPETHIRYVVVAMGQKGAVKPVDPLENPPEHFRVVG